MAPELGGGGADVLGCCLPIKHAVSEEYASKKKAQLSLLV